MTINSRVFQNINYQKPTHGYFLEYNTDTFRPGDVLRIWFRGIFHYGIYVGQDWVIDNSKRDCGVAKVSLETFGSGCEITNLGHRGRLSRDEVVERAFAQLGRRWDCISFNCETFYRGCQGRLEISPQVLTVGLLAILLASLSSR